MHNQLIGTWKIDPNDKASLEAYGEVTMEFLDNGKLIYTIHLENKAQKIYMSYQIIENILITDQPSSPKKEETEYTLLPDGKLILNFGGVASKYIKI